MAALWRRRLEQPALQLLISAYDLGCAGEFCRRQGIRDRDDRHSRGQGRVYSGRRVFDHAAICRFDAEQPGRTQENVRRGFAVGDVLRADDRPEQMTQIAQGENGIDGRMPRAGGQPKRITPRHFFEQFRQTLEYPFLPPNQGGEFFVLSREQLFQRLRRAMPGDEIAPDHHIGLAVINREINSVCPAKTDLVEHFAKGALVQRLAVHNHAVHVKNDGSKFFHPCAAARVPPAVEGGNLPPDPALRSTKCRRFPSPSLKNNTRPPPPAGWIDSSKITPWRISASRATSIESTRNARCRQPASLLSPGWSRAESAGYISIIRSPPNASRNAGGVFPSAKTSRAPNTAAYHCLSAMGLRAANPICSTASCINSFSA